MKTTPAQRAAKRNWNKKNPAKKAALQNAYREKYPDRWIAYARKYAGLPEPTRPESPVCECCGSPPGRVRLHLDHDHETGKFRGWLCNKCNGAIGLLGDNLEGVTRAVTYLLRNSKQ